MALARSQCGVFTARQAERLGSPGDVLHRAVRRGELVRVRRSAYVVGDAWAGADPTARFTLRTRAILMTLGPDHWASHHAALGLRGVALWGHSLDVVDVMCSTPRVRTVAGLRRHPRPSHLNVGVVSGIRAVSLPVALAQVAASGTVEGAVVALDSGLRARAVSRAEVSNAAAGLDLDGRSRERVAQVVAQSDPACESVGESRTRHLLHTLGFAPRSQVDIHDADGLVGRVDFLVRGRVVVEFDGLVKYAAADGREALAREKRREDRLRAAGYEVVRLTWADLDDPERVSRLVRAALGRAAQRQSA